MLSWSFLNRDEVSRHRSFQMNQEPYIIWYVLSGNTQRHFFQRPKLWVGLRCCTVTQVAGKRNESICRRISGHWDHQDPDPEGINQSQIHCIIQLSRGVGVVSVTQCEDYMKCGLGTCSLRKLKNLMLMDQLPATLLWMILSLRLSAFLPVFENLLCFLFVVFGAAMRKQHLESNNVKMSGVSWKRWIGYVMSSENPKKRKIMLLSGACGVLRWLLQTMQIDGMMVVFLLLLKLLGNSGEGCSLSFTLLVPKDSLGCVYAGAVSIIRQIAGLETGLFSRWQCFTLE